MGSAMNRAGVAWISQRGARVVRLATEADNVAARKQVENLGYRVTATWTYSTFEIGGTGRLPRERRLHEAHPSDVDPAWMFWSAGDLYHDGRGLIALGWRWRRARPEDLVDAARAKTLFQCPSGWAILDQPTEDALRLIWLATTPDEAHQVIDALVDLATRRGVAELNLKTPATPWMAEAIRRAGGGTSEILVYSLPV